ncbi:MAG: hypothetical protein MMC33_010622 [Icmadophila ericetorum]|nr:hypothetical protein [Icmadophila ericetorum]
MYARNDSSIAQAILANEGPDAYEAYIRSMDSYWRSMDAKREAKRARQAARKEFLLRKKERLEEFLVLAKFAKLAVAGKLGFTSALL